jgi:hypothetical protein
MFSYLRPFRKLNWIHIGFAIGTVPALGVSVERLLASQFHPMQQSLPELASCSSNVLE